MSPERQSEDSGRWVRNAIFAAAGIGLLVLLGRQGAQFAPAAIEAVRSLGPWAWAGYIGLYIVATVAWVPGSILTLASGVLFGLWMGTLLTLVGATAGATAAFLVARYVARTTVERKLGDRPRLRAIDRALSRRGARLVFLIRLSPAIPFNALNYALGVTGVPLRSYIWTSFLGMVPGTFLYVYAGYAAGQISGAVDAEPRGWGYWTLLGVGLLATIAATILVTRVARRAVDQATSNARDQPDEKTDESVS